MRIKNKVTIVILSAALTAASCSCQTASEPPIFSPVHISDKPVQIENGGLPEMSYITADSSPKDQVQSPGASHWWQVCTWNLYGLFMTPQTKPAGQAVTIGAFIYIEDFPITDVDADLLVNGLVTMRQTISVNFDEAWPFYFSFVPDKPGDYNITIRAILDMNAAWANEPGGGDNYYSVSSVMTVQA